MKNRLYRILYKPKSESLQRKRRPGAAVVTKVISWCLKHNPSPLVLFLTMAMVPHGTTTHLQGECLGTSNTLLILSKPEFVVKCVC